MSREGKYSFDCVILDKLGYHKLLKNIFQFNFDLSFIFQQIQQSQNQEKLFLGCNVIPDIRQKLEMKHLFGNHFQFINYNKHQNSERILLHYYCIRCYCIYAV